MVGNKANAAAVLKYTHRVPNLELEAKIQPITSTIMRTDGRCAMRRSEPSGILRGLGAHRATPCANSLALPC